MIEISKELLSEVLDEKISEILPDRKIIGSEKTLEYVAENSFRPYNYINIYELANKCKEWAENKDYYIVSGTWALQGEKQKACIIGKPKPLENFIANTEVEAIFKACEWILKEINK